MRILLVGKFSLGSLESSYSRAFSALGATVTEIDTRWLDQELAWWVRTRLPHRLTLNSYHLRSFGTRAWNENLLEIVRHHDPSLVLFFNGHFVFPETVRAIRGRGIPCVSYFADNPLSGNYNARPEILPSARVMDYFFVWSPHLQQKLMKLGINAVYLPFAWDPELHPFNATADDPTDYRPNIDVVFIGNWDAQREKILEKIAQNFRLQIWGSRYWGQRTRRGALVRKAWQGTEASGKNAAMIMRQSKVCLNLYREQHRFHGEYNGTIMRNFEVPGAGGFLFSPTNSAVADIFPPGEAGVYFPSEADCIKQLGFLLEDEKQRNRIAHRAQEIVSTGHTYLHRGEKILELAGIKIKGQGSANGGGQ